MSFVVFEIFDRCRWRRFIIPSAFATRDIYAYVSKQLEELDFQDKELAILAEKADGLFEWARLVYEYIKNSDTGLSPKDCHGTVVSRGPAERSALLYDVYRLIFTGIMHGETSLHLPKLAKILGTAEPLPIASLNAVRRYFSMPENDFDVEPAQRNHEPRLPNPTPSCIIQRFLDEPSCQLLVVGTSLRVELDIGSHKVPSRQLSQSLCDPAEPAGAASPIGYF